MTAPIPPTTVKPRPPSQRPRPEGPAIRRAVTEACAIALWEVSPNRIRELSGLPESSDELTAHRIDMFLSLARHGCSRTGPASYGGRTGSETRKY